jgi:hypothetical protein
MKGILQRGGAPCIDFLDFCLKCAKLEALFVYLVELEYKIKPTKTRALALYDVFCAPNAPLRVNCDQFLPPIDTTLSTAIQAVRAEQQQASQMSKIMRKLTANTRVPPFLIFDRVVEAVFGNHGNENCITDICRSYDPGNSVSENLKKGRIGDSSITFAGAAWVGMPRNTLLAAGFKIVPALWGGGM